jgi:hypothetical protein
MVLSRVTLGDFGLGCKKQEIIVLSEGWRPIRISRKDLPRQKRRFEVKIIWLR